jgi:biotin carboxylase
MCVRTAVALGFFDGVLHAEAKDASRGPRILEVNARFGGCAITLHHQMVTGVDLVEQQLLIGPGSPSHRSHSPTRRAPARTLSCRRRGLARSVTLGSSTTSPPTGPCSTQPSPPRRASISRPPQTGSRPSSPSFRLRTRRRQRSPPRTRPGRRITIPIE